MALYGFHTLVSVGGTNNFGDAGQSIGILGAVFAKASDPAGAEEVRSSGLAGGFAVACS